MSHLKLSINWIFVILTLAAICALYFYTVKGCTLIEKILQDENIINSLPLEYREKQDVASMNVSIVYSAILQGLSFALILLLFFLILKHTLILETGEYKFTDRAGNALKSLIQGYQLN